jgi:Predicted transcriptional regulator
MKTIVLKLPQEVRGKLEILATSTGKDPSAIVAEAVEWYVEAQLAALASGHRNEKDGKATYSPRTLKA